MEIEALTKLQSNPDNKTKGRSSVSAEAYGLWNTKKSYVPVVVPKSEQTKAALKAKLLQSFMFKSLDPEDLEIVINAMKEVKFNQGEQVIKQGDDGDVLYFVFSGSLDCNKLYPGHTEPTYLLTYSAGMSFGELALLYNCPRAANIYAKEASVVYALDRECFNGIVKESTIKKRELYDEFLSKVDLLQELEPYERSIICDVLSPLSYKAGEKIISEGDSGDSLYFIEKGKAYATKKNAQGLQDRVYDYSKNDYFGELALLKDVPRQASVIAMVNFF
jgi:cAMP-dependent protein kinase regulator